MKPANLIAMSVVATSIGVLWVFSARGELAEKKARELLERGARVVDVRTVAEFNTRRLTNVVNIPLADLKQKLPGVVTNRSDVILLHCRTGRRSGIAETELRALGYTNTFNIGSFERAKKLLATDERK